MMPATACSGLSSVSRLALTRFISFPYCIDECAINGGQVENYSLSQSLRLWKGCALAVGSRSVVLTSRGDFGVGRDLSTGRRYLYKAETHSCEAYPLRVCSRTWKSRFRSWSFVRKAVIVRHACSTVV